MKKGLPAKWAVLLFKCRVKSAECRVVEDFLTLFGNHFYKILFELARKVTLICSVPTEVDNL